MTVNAGAGAEFHGAILALFHLVTSRPDKLGALHRAFFRPLLPNISSLIATVLIFVLVVFLQGLHVKLPQSIVVDGRRRPVDPFTIKLFYTSNIPIILQAAVVSQIYFISQSLYLSFRSNPFVRLLGTWDDSNPNNIRPTGGIAWALRPPEGIEEFFVEPFRFLFYILFMLGSCAGFAVVWIYVSRQSPADILAQVPAGQKRQIGSSGDSIKILNNYIPTAAALGGMCIGALSVFSDLLGARGSGTSMLLAVTIIYQYYEQLIKEGVASGELNLDRFLRGTQGAARVQ
jgi:protein transport protein SEC61 subunit alpha